MRLKRLPLALLLACLSSAALAVEPKPSDKQAAAWVKKTLAKPQPQVKPQTQPQPKPR